jgi:TrmH family RNA methyltransferase
MTPGGRRRLARFVIEGTRLHERALRAGIRIDRTVVAQSFVESTAARPRELLEQLRAAGTVVHVAPDHVLAELTEGRSIGAVVGLAALAAAPPLEAILAAAAPRPPVLLVAADVEEPGNVGALVRTALAAGAVAFVASGISDALHPKAVRTSMGSLFRIPIVREEKPELAVERLREAGVRTVGATASGGTPLPDLALDGRPLAVVVGGEAFGLPPAVAGRLDERVTIPMGSEVDSYSVNAAAAIVLYEIRRRSLPS